MKPLILIIFTFAVVFSSKNIAAKGEQINFELASIDGSKFISNQSFLGKTTILIFFDIDCPPCIKKLEQLKNLAVDFDEVNFAVINLSSRKEAKNFILEFGLNQKIELLQAPQNSKAFLRKFGNNSGALPYVVLLTKNGNHCLSKNELPDNLEIEKC